MRGQNKVLQQTSYGHCFPFVFAPFRRWCQLILNSCINTLNIGTYFLLLLKFCCCTMSLTANYNTNIEYYTHCANDYSICSSIFNHIGNVHFASHSSVILHYAKLIYSTYVQIISNITHCSCFMLCDWSITCR